MKPGAWALFFAFAFGGHCASAATAGLSDLEAQSHSICVDQPEAEDFADRLQGLRASGAISNDDLAKDAPDALLRLAEIERFRGQFDLAEKDYTEVAKIGGLTGGKALEEIPSLAWDRKLRQALGVEAMKVVHPRMG